MDVEKSDGLAPRLRGAVEMAMSMPQQFGRETSLEAQDMFGVVRHDCSDRV